MKSKVSWIVGGLCLTALFFLFWNLSATPVREWDEARHASNAWEMAQRGDYINYYFNGEPDFWNAKPPLQVWLIVAGSKLFGFNELTLRLPSAIAGMVALFFIFRIGMIFGGPVLGALAIFVAQTSKALIGFHVTRTGDMDAVYIASIAAATYFVLRATQEQKYRGWMAGGLSLGFAFLAKGFMFGLAMPGFMILLARSKWKSQISSKSLWAGLFILSLFPIAWFVLVQNFGLVDPSKKYQSSNSFGVMIIYDIFGRFFGNMGGEKPPLNAQAVFAYLDIRLGAWLYWSVIAGLFVLATSRLRSTKSILFYSPEWRSRALLYALATSIPLILLVALSRHKNDWYVAGLAMSWPILCAVLLDCVLTYEKAMARKLMTGVFAICALVATVNMLVYVATPPPASAFKAFVHANADRLRQAEVVKIDKLFRQDDVAYLAWVGVKRVTDFDSGLPLPEAYQVNCSGTVCEIRGPR